MGRLYKGILNTAILSLIMWAVLISLASAQSRLYPERHYQEVWCNEHGGQTEVIQPDRTRVDCITYAHALEFDFASKWAEALGQALHYGRLTGLRAGIVLIVENPRDMRYVERLRENIDYYSLPVDLYTTK